MSESFAQYLPHIRRRWEQEQAGWQARRVRAWESARRAAEVLRTRFGATRVIAFGSLIDSGMFHERSDIDLAVQGIPPDKFFQAVAAALGASEFEVDLVDLDVCPAQMRDKVLGEGVLL